MEADPYTDDYVDEISELVEEAHAIVNTISVCEVMGMDDYPGTDFTDRYLRVKRG